MQSTVPWRNLYAHVIIIIIGCSELLKTTIYITPLQYYPAFWALLTIVAAFILPCFFHQFSKSVIFFTPSLPVCHSLRLYPVIHRRVNIRGIVFLCTLTLWKQMRNANKICLIFFLKRRLSHYYSYLSSIALPFKTWLKKIGILRLVKIPLLLLYGQ